MKIQMVKYWMDGRPIVEQADRLGEKSRRALEKIGVKLDFFDVPMDPPR